MLQTIVDALNKEYKALLSQDQERGGYIDIQGDSVHVVELPSADEALEKPAPGALKYYVWSAAYPCIWHTHPGGRGTLYEAPSGDDIASAARMSLELGSPVTGYVLEPRGTWCYTVYVPESIKDPEFLDELYWVYNTWATRLGGRVEYLKGYEDAQNQVPLSSVEEYLALCKKHAERLHNTVTVEFTPRSSKLFNVLALCEPDSPFDLEDGISRLLEVKRSLKKKPPTGDKLEQLVKSLDEVNQAFVLRETDDKSRIFYLELEIDRILTRIAAPIPRFVELALAKQYVRHLLQARESALHSSEPFVTAWTTVDSFTYAFEPLSCADVMCVDSSNSKYSPPLPQSAFDGALLRLCDPYVDLRVIMTSLKPLAILVFEGLRGVQQTRDEDWGKDSQVDPLVKSGELVHVGGEYRPPRSGELSEMHPFTTFLYVPKGSVAQADVERALLAASDLQVSPENWKQECRQFHQFL